MPTRSAKKLDINQLAKAILDEAVGDAPKTEVVLVGKKAAGSKGGLKGGKSRMALLTPEQRTALALKGVAARKKASAVVAEALVKK